MNKSLLLTFTFVSVFSLVACNNGGKIDQSTADSNLLLGLAAGQADGKASVLSSLTEIRGLWKDGFCSGGSCTGFTSNLAIVQDPTGFGVWTTGSGYFRIIEASNTGKYLIYQYLSDASFGNANKYTKILWTAPQTTDCENSASKCFYYCTVLNASFTGYDSLEEARNVVLDSTKYNTSNPKSSGCGGFGWSKALFVSSNPTSWP